MALVPINNAISRYVTTNNAAQVLQIFNQVVQAGGNARDLYRALQEVVTSETARDIVGTVNYGLEQGGHAWEEMQTALQHEEPTNWQELVVGTAGAAAGGLMGVAGGMAGIMGGAAVGHRGMINAYREVRERTGINAMIDQANREAQELDIWDENAVNEMNEWTPTTLDELIPENAAMETSAPATSEPVVAAAAARMGGGGGPGGSVSKETPISNYPSLTYGLQETHTTIIPFTAWLGAAKFDIDNPVQLSIRMNSIYDMLHGLTIQNGTSTLTKGFYNRPIKENGGLSSTAADGAIPLGVGFPDILPTGDTVSERPAWRDYWTPLYQYYTVLGCEYKITVYNPVSEIGANVLIGTQFDSYSDTASSSGNIMPLTRLADAMAWKNMRWDVVSYSRSEVANKNTTVIAGTYKPGQAKRNIVNDGDVKTWTPTSNTGSPSSSIPNLKEILTINFWKAPLGWNANTGVNMQIELKYIVQFKDLHENARYPNVDQFNIVQTLPEDIIMLQKIVE